MSHLPTEAVQMMRQEIVNDPSFVVELAQMAGLPTAEDLAAEQQARADMEDAQQERLSTLESTSGNLLDSIRAEEDARIETDESLQSQINTLGSSRGRQ